jgi:hypothetical protein
MKSWFSIGKQSNQPYVDDNGINREIGFCRKFSFRPYGSEAVNDPEYDYGY